MFERFTESALRAVGRFAEEEARTLSHNHIGTEHLLLGLLREEEGIAAQVLTDLGIFPDEVRPQVQRIVEPSDHTPERLPLTPRAKKVIELSLREALSLGHNYIDTEHVLLGIVREGEGVASRILLDFDADAEKIRNEIIKALSGPTAKRRAKRRPDTDILEPKIEVGLAREIVAFRERLRGDLQLQDNHPLVRICEILKREI
jgi:ATP-dependent Clp protease ATP-binding subunit ClpC